MYHKLNAQHLPAAIILVRFLRQTSFNYFIQKCLYFILSYSIITYGPIAVTLIAMSIFHLQRITVITPINNNSSAETVNFHNYAQD